LVGEAVEAFCFGALVAVLGVVGVDEGLKVLIGDVRVLCKKRIQN